MNVLAEHLGFIASLIGSLTVVGSALLWIHTKLISNPRERRRERENIKRQKQMINMITRENKPLNDSINTLSEILEDSIRDRKRLSEIAVKNTGIIKEHDETLEEHDKRLIILETKNGLSEYRYKKGGE